ncbi:hypothetical protein [Mucilaginibacter paludis]|uniref:Uncharacterized protein n=1 Tax=Mucilaginibacter paludis DSM 18603 TaxID=714943 RepID=H1Y9X1_9SPHI|nr:hypothetical protein [Mucilaginibacter paludis]EHQ31154.1 hypothetical protein Mucpa_7111 [Mucilaginibacter paludis DSM 18603]
MKQIEKVKQQLRELAEPVNSFTSELVQLKVVDWLLNHLEHWNKKNHDSDLPSSDAKVTTSGTSLNEDQPSDKAEDVMQTLES